MLHLIATLSLELKMTHSDVPDAFTVGFVGTGESFTGHDARVCDQVASTVEDGPERVTHTHTTTDQLQFNIKIDFLRWKKMELYWEYWCESSCTHTHFNICTKNPQWHSLSLFSEFGEVPNEFSWFVFFHKTWSN